MYFILNLATVFFPVRTDRHILCQITNTLLVLLMGSGDTYTKSNLPLRCSLACVSVVINMMLEDQSRRSFVLEHQQTHRRRSQLASRKHAKERVDWFRWGAGDEDARKSATAKDGDVHAQAKKCD